MYPVSLDSNKLTKTNLNVRASGSLIYIINVQVLVVEDDFLFMLHVGGSLHFQEMFKQYNLIEVC